MPENLQALLILLFFIAPGFLFTHACQCRLPRYYREPNLFHQTITAIVASVLIHALLLLLLLGGLALTGLVAPSISLALKFAKPLQDYSNGELVLVTGYATFSLAAGWYSGLAFQRILIAETPGFRRFVRLLLGLSKQEIPLWGVLIRDLAEGRSVRLKVHLRNGDECIGNVEHLRWVGEKDVVFELILKDVSYTRAPGMNPAPATRRLPGHHLLLLSGDILWLSRIDIDTLLGGRPP